MDEIKSLQAEITSLISQRNLYKQKYEELQAKLNSYFNDNTIANILAADYKLD